MITFYTCITSNIGYVPNISNIKVDGHRYICFYDDDKSYNDHLGWEFVKIDQSILELEYRNLSPRLIQRLIKLKPNIFIKNNSDYFCWVDPRFIIKSNIFFKYFDELEKINPTLVLLKHPNRQSLADDFVWAYTTGKMTFGQCAYTVNKISNLNNSNFWLSTLNVVYFRKNTENVNRFGNIWFDMLYNFFELKTHSIRDQIILPFALIQSKIDLDSISFFDYYSHGGLYEWYQYLDIELAEYEHDLTNCFDWRDNIIELLTLIKDKTGSCIHSPMFGTLNV